MAILRRVPAAAAVLALAACEESSYRDLAELTRAEEAAGWKVVGHFGDGWPASVVAEEHGQGEIEFTLADGQRHGYSGFDGYGLKLLRLRGEDGGEVAVVLRAERRSASPAAPR